MSSAEPASFVAEGDRTSADRPFPLGPAQCPAGCPSVRCGRRRGARGSGQRVRAEERPMTEGVFEVSRVVRFVTPPGRTATPLGRAGVRHGRGRQVRARRVSCADRLRGPTGPLSRRMLSLARPAEPPGHRRGGRAVGRPSAVPQPAASRRLLRALRRVDTPLQHLRSAAGPLPRVRLPPRQSDLARLRAADPEPLPRRLADTRGVGPDRCEAAKSSGHRRRRRCLTQFVGPTAD